MEETAERYRAVFDASPDGIVLVDTSGRICDLNPRAERLFGYDREEILDAPVETLVPESLRELHRGERRGYVEDPTPRPMGVGMELRARRKDGEHLPVEISLSPLEGPGGSLVIATVRDISERKRLREFGAGALRAAEEERRRIARELHDDAAQRVSGLQLRLQAARVARDPGRRARLLDEAREELVACAEAIRRIARGLRPSALQEASFEAAVRAHLRDRLGDSALETRLDLQPVDDLLGEDEKLVLYRIFQEAVSNALRHAGADRLEVSVRRESNGVTLRVRDDGRGFEISDGGTPSGSGAGLGLIGMRERAGLVGGELRIESAPGTGTEVRLRMEPGATNENTR